MVIVTYKAYNPSDRQLQDLPQTAKNVLHALHKAISHSTQAIAGPSSVPGHQSPSPLLPAEQEWLSKQAHVEDMPEDEADGMEYKIEMPDAQDGAANDQATKQMRDDYTMPLNPQDIDMHLQDTLDEDILHIQLALDTFTFEEAPFEYTDENPEPNDLDVDKFFNPEEQGMELADQDTEPQQVQNAQAARDATTEAQQGSKTKTIERSHLKLLNLPHLINLLNPMFMLPPATCIKKLTISIGVLALKMPMHTNPTTGFVDLSQDQALHISLHYMPGNPSDARYTGKCRNIEKEIPGLQCLSKDQVLKKLARMTGVKEMRSSRAGWQLPQVP
ncbi:hypothetical protein CONPUDRAFT_70998 [Coniophora puteana RWD-64-598 SS2]|uniref:Uncharacterized protein n=1 Tax=Coniophora puteana (strain RWD-64-598) TaxID=741705 RepID=A0A5M3MYQ4_CONPW|nr:uncharacterized protein CONPUDRAFT_70998 [Coniophora puteana RWD-64-598 SS2]EIW84157.1 hypothetical protein CONPUDRAFT_70998 [Coniophora puteana RWD-64-598 SS2]